MRKRFLNQWNSDRADTNTTSQLLWLGIIVVVVIAVVTAIAKGIGQMGDSAVGKLKDANTEFDNMIQNEGFNNLQ